MEHVSDKLKNSPVFLRSLETKSESCQGGRRNKKGVRLKPKPACVQLLLAYEYVNPEVLSQPGAIDLKKSPAFIQALAKKADKDEKALQRVLQNGAAPELLQDKDFIMDTIVFTKNPVVFQFAGETVRDDKNVVLWLMKSKEYIKSLKFAGNEAVKSVVLNDGLLLEFVSDTQKRDRDIVAAAVGKNAGALKFALGSPKSDAEIVRTAISASKSHGSGSNFKFAAPELQDDTVLFSSLLGERENENKQTEPELDAALRWAGPGVKSDPVLIGKLVGKYGNLLKHASKELRGDPNIAAAATKNALSAVEFVDPEVAKQVLIWKGFTNGNLRCARSARRGVWYFCRTLITRP